MPASSYPFLRKLVRVLRIQRGWTQEELAEKAGCDYKYFQLFEIGRTSTPALQTVEKLAKTLGTKPWVLLCEDAGLIADATGLDPAQFTRTAHPRPGRPRKIVKND